MAMRVRGLVKRLGFLLLVLLVGWAAIEAKRFLERPPAVDIVTVERGDLTRLLAVTGRIRPLARNQIASIVAGRLVELRKEEGDSVVTGEVLARLDARRAAAELERAQAELKQAEVEIEQKRRDLSRARELAASGLLSIAELEAARLAVESRLDGIESLRRTVTSLEARLDDYVLRAPLSGVVLRRPVDPGQNIAAQEMIYEIATDAEPLVEVEVDEQFVSELAVGMAATVRTLRGRRISMPAKIIHIGRVVDRASGAVIVRLRFDAAPPPLPVDLALDVNLVIEQHRAALSVPRSALVDITGSPWVLTVEGLRTVRRPVEVIDWPAPRLVVTGGLEEGESVVLEPRSTAVGIEVRTHPVDDAV